MRLQSLWLVALVILLHGALSADTVHLKNGKQLRGEIIEETEEYIVLRVPFGQVKVKQEEVDYVDRQPQQEYKAELGRELVSQQRYSLAIDELEKARAAAPQNKDLAAELVRAYTAYGKHLLQVRRLEEARIIYEKLRALDPASTASDDALRLLDNESKNLDVLVDRARKAAAGQDLNAAVAAYDQALAFSAGARERIAGEFAHALARRAELSFRSKKFDACMADLERAFGLDPKLTGPLEGLYAAGALSRIMALIQAGEIATAQQYLQRVLTFAPTNPLVLYIAGRVQESVRDLGGAAGYYARGLRTTVNHPNAEIVADLRGKLEKTLNLQPDGGGMQVETRSVDEAAYSDAKPGAFESYETDRFVILHHNEALAREVGRVLEAHHTRIAGTTRLKAEWKEKPRVYLHRTQEEYTLATSQPEWTGGVSRFTHTPRGLAGMQIHSWQTSPRLFKSVLPHELAHLIFNENLPAYDALPRALHEGFAILMEPDFRQSYFVNFLRMRLKSQDFISLSELLRARDYPRDPDFFYAEGFALLAFLTKEKGFETTMKLVLEPSKPGEIDKKILELSGYESLEKLEASWKDWILKGK